MRLLYGRPVAERIETRSGERSAALQARRVAPRLAVVSVGADAAANTYLGRIVARGTRIGVAVDDVALPHDASERDLTATLERLARDRAVHGVLLLTPLPAALQGARVADRIAVDKDVEGMNPFNAGLLAEGRPSFVPSTAEAAVRLLEFYEIPLAGVRAAIVGRSAVIGRPLAALLLAKDATVTIAHSKTPDLAAITRDADVVVVGAGRAGLLRGDMVRPGVTVIDAGINVTPSGLVGDVDAASMTTVAAALSPVPGGLGAVTTALLLQNVLTAAEKLTAD
ncbi:MAG: bifunctional 5,10-methylenetetrahydrofolate dehydrogenase/5,10-methenyltetrahydrofolate cyclohydrolase [Chloroflexi bacterium]|nr:MAG: bifunctional 5,10-methylenetetrahydrofolate dehydrogenase/5,10-methenyltetrahydrofolate cyclohydrolase [Chloroflexota bacterium]